ncbi:hypothetical protein [Bacillus sp. EAC]|uniref:hypothetical protein n=1 Tax=Bacillus sp. EAC TaxID=1978338 RepID=UPI0011551279|nr:hypothetical protein [Bacillus sp. EAC]
MSKTKDQIQNKPNVPKININLINKKRNKHNTIYTFKLYNNSTQTIKQSSVYLHYNIKLPQGVRNNPFKVEAKGNKLNIKPDEKVTLTVTIPNESGLKTNILDINHPVIEVVGYINKISNDNLFHLTLKVKNN